MSETTNNAIMLANGQLFNDVDFRGLSSAISKLGEHSKELTPDEKNHACSIVKEWEGTIIARLNSKNNELCNFLYYFDKKVVAHEQVYDRYRRNGWSNASNHNISRERTGSSVVTNEMEEKMAQETKLVPEFETYVEAMEAYFDHLDARPERLTNIDTNTLEGIKEDSDNRLAGRKWELESKKFAHKANEANRRWKDALVKEPEIKDMINKAKSFNSQVNKLREDCRVKSQMARVNVYISSAETRKGIQELLRFSETI